MTQQRIAAIILAILFCFDAGRAPSQETESPPPQPPQESPPSPSEPAKPTTPPSEPAQQAPSADLRKAPRRLSKPVEVYTFGEQPVSTATEKNVRQRDFELRPTTTPVDILTSSVPGLYTVQHQGGGKADQYFLRGFDADHGTDFAIYVDGIPVNCRITPTAKDTPIFIG